VHKEAIVIAGKPLVMPSSTRSARLPTTISSPS
jgi:hypothetical protein